MAANNDDPIGSAAAAELLGVHRSTITRMVASGKLTPAFHGTGTTGEKFFKPSDVQALLTPPVLPVSGTPGKTGASRAPGGAP